MWRCCGASGKLHGFERGVDAEGHWKLDWKLDWERLNHSLGHGFDAGQRRQLWEDDSGLSQQGQIECVAEGDEMAVTGARLERIGCAPGVEGRGGQHGRASYEVLGYCLWRDFISCFGQVYKLGATGLGV